MSVYVDNERIAWRGKLWCHLVADSLEELHGFASRLGLKRGWFQDRTRYPHYDVTIQVRERALQLGALDGDRASVVSCSKRLRVELRKARTGQGFISIPMEGFDDRPTQ